MTAKKTLTAIALCCTFFVHAGHELGGIIITYKSLLAATGDSLKYELKVYAVYDKFGVPSPTTLNVSLSSSCFGNSSFSLPRTGTSTGLLPLLGADYCSSTSTINSQNGLAIYADTITLPGKCANFRFFHSGGFGRYNNTSNIQNGFQTAYFFADLNNLQGPNSAPITGINGLIQAACLNKPLNLYGFTEADGDSVAYEASAPSYITGSTVANFGFNPGYSASNPVNSPFGYGVNPNTGWVQTQLNAIGNFILTIAYEEYRKDTANNSVLIGKGKYIMYLVGTSACNSDPFDLTLVNGQNQDSISCGQNEVKLSTTRKIAANTLTTNGSEFVITSAKNGLLAINSASISADSLITLNMQQNIAANDTLFIWSENGSDNNVLFSQCGKEIIAYQDTFAYYSPTSASPVAQFGYTQNFLNANFSANLPADSVIWNFGDGNTSTGNTNPMHQYASGGTYLVELIVFNKCGLSDTTVQSILICDSIMSGINYAITGNSVSFNALNPSATYSYIWNLGDGSTRFDSSFTYQYSTTGIYSVWLTVINACGDSTVYNSNVAYCEEPKAAFTANIVSSGGSGMQVDFDGSQSIGASSFIWDFGDGNTNTTSLTPTHNYSTPSLAYVVKLRVTNNCSESDSLAYALENIGLAEIETSVLQVYPNPTSDYAIIEGFISNEDVEIEVFDLTGALIYNQKFESNNGSIMLDVSKWNNGNYMIKIASNGAIIVKRISVLH